MDYRLRVMQELNGINIPGLGEIEKSNRRHGRIKTIFNQFQAALPAVLLFVLAASIIAGVNAYLNLNERISTIENFYITNSNSNQVTVNTANSTSNSDDQIITNANQRSDTLGLTTGFVPENWIISGFKVDEEGYYCRNKRGFDYWSIWTKENYPPLLNKIKIKFALKQERKTDFPPTIAISYGEYKANGSPIQFYRLNIFDTDTKTLRLYNNKNDSKSQAWLEFEPDLSSEMTITLSPASSNRESREISINPTLIYVNEESTDPITFKPNSDFNVVLPTVGIDDGSVKKQIGIGSTDGICFKVVDFEIN